MSSVIDRPAVGALLREWRKRRRMSQLGLALEASISTRHLSFVETGRSRPSAELVMHLGEQLDVPLRERNGLLLAAGYAPVYGQRDLAEPQMGPVREALERVLAGHEPYPALVVDRHWGWAATPPDLRAGAIAVPLILLDGDAELTFISTVTTFGTAIDVTVAELSIEAFFPGDAVTEQRLRALSAQAPAA